MIETGSDLLGLGVLRLKHCLGATAKNDVLLLLAEVLKINRSSLVGYLNDPVDAKDKKYFFKMLAQRENLQPMAQILGRRAFWGRDFKVNSDVLDPRPDTETLIELALKNGKKEHILDLGTGSGCLLLTLLAEWETAFGVGVDISIAALKIASENAKALRVEGRCRLQEGNWCEGLLGDFDLIISNPPYISELEMASLQQDVKDWEPHIALTPGADGLSAYRQIARDCVRILKPNGVLMVEIGWKQADSVADILQKNGWKNINVHQDINKKDRILSASL